ncbi:MAG: hypothetical protein JSR85_08775 [Proteobacteria bacterium]|nr:hypothetical protein [Pseudomonadota bacterium]
MGEKLTKWAAFIGGVLFLFPENGVAQTSAPKTETMDIQTDLPPPASAEEVVPKHPFFSEPTTGNEVFEEVEELKDRVKKLEEKVEGGKMAEKSNGDLVIESKGNIEINTPGIVKFNAKSVELPKAK